MNRPNSTDRMIAIGDIHGCSTALAALIDQIDLQPTDTIVTLGDYVDRGADSKGALDFLLTLVGRCHLVPILGNHDQMMLHAKNGPAEFERWMSCGGGVALDSYGKNRKLDLIPAEHFTFLERCVPYFETETHLFLHANYDPQLPLSQTDDHTLRWLSLRDSVPGPHVSGKIAVLGHTPQPDVLDLGHLVCIDTHCCKNGRLTAFDVTTKRKWQVDKNGW